METRGNYLAPVLVGLALAAQDAEAVMGFLGTGYMGTETKRETSALDDQEFRQSLQEVVWPITDLALKQQSFDTCGGIDADSTKAEREQVLRCYEGLKWLDHSNSMVTRAVHNAAASVDYCGWGNEEELLQSLSMAEKGCYPVELSGCEANFEETLEQSAWLLVLAELEDRKINSL